MNEDNKDRKSKKKEFVDDGRTIVDMNVDGFRWYVPAKTKRQKSELSGLNITKEERRAMMKGAFLAVLPVLFAALGVFTAIFLLTYAWLSQ